MNSFLNKPRKRVSVDENVLSDRMDLAPRRIDMGYMESNQMFLDGANGGLINFDLPSFVGEKMWDKLTHLYLARNELISLPDELFKQARNLKWLDVRWNNIMQFPVSVRGHLALKTLLLQNNDLQKLPIELGSIHTLHCLAIANNPLDFPTKSVLSQLRSNRDLINYLKRCWKEQSVDVVPVPNTRPKRKRLSKEKLRPVRRMKDHTEVISKLRNSVSIKDQVMAERMLHALELEQKIVQSFKDQDVLKKWRDAYRESQGSSLGKRNDFSLSSLFGVGGHEEPVAPPLDRADYITGDINQVIADLQKQLSLIPMSDSARDPETVMKGRKREIKSVNEIMKKVAYLKHHC